MSQELFSIIDAAWKNRDLLKEKATKEAISEIIELIDKGKIRVAEQINGYWEVNDSVKKAVILYFPIQNMNTSKAGVLEFYDKIPLKTNYEELGIRVVPPAVARYGSYISKGVILMPSYVNIGAYVDEGTMVDILI